MKKNAEVKIVYLPIDEIRDYENNPRDNDKAVEAVVKSFERFGVRSPAIIDKDNVLIAGHTRLKAARQMGMTEFPCVRADDLTKAEAKGLRLADNRIQEDSIWDTEALAQEFKALRETGFDLSDTGFDEFEISGIGAGTGESLFDFAESETDPVEYDTPEMESGEYYTDDEPPEDDENDPDAESVCVFCCRNSDEKEALAALIGEQGELRRHYTVTEVRKMLGDEAEDAE